MSATPAAAVRGPSPQLVTLVALLVVAALAGLPGVGPETWVGVAGSAPLALVARGGAGALGLLHAVAVALVALAVLRATVGLADPLRRVVALVVALAGCAAVPAGTRLLGLVLAAWTLVLWGRAARGAGARGATRAAGGGVLLVALWALLDPTWVLGPVLGLAVAAGARADARNAAARRVLAATGGALLAGAAAAGVLLLASRDGADLLRTWAAALWSGPVPGGTGPRPVTDPLVLLVLVPLVLVVGSWLRSGRTPDRSTPVLAGLAVLLALGPAGTSPAAGIVAAVVVATALGARSSSTAARGLPGVLVVAVALLLAAVPAWVTSSSAAAQDPVARLRPALTALPSGTSVLADPRLGPRVRAGRTAAVVDVPPGPLLATLRAEPGWREVVAGSGARAALLTDEAPLLAALEERLGWRVAARSGPVVLVRAPAP